MVKLITTKEVFLRLRIQYFELYHKTHQIHTYKIPTAKSNHAHPDAHLNHHNYHYPSSTPPQPQPPLDNLPTNPNNNNNHPRPRHNSSTLHTNKSVLPAIDLRLLDDPFLFLVLILALQRRNNTRYISRCGGAWLWYRGVGLVD